MWFGRSLCSQRGQVRSQTTGKSCVVCDVCGLPMFGRDGAGLARLIGRAGEDRIARGRPGRGVALEAS